MKLTRKFTFALICGVLVVQVGFAALRARREQRLFHVDIAREEKVLGHSLAISAQTVARTSGEELARDLIEKANLFDSHVQIRWVELDGAGEAWRPRATAADLAPVRSGEQVALELGEPDEVAVYTYSPITLPDGRVAAVEVSDSLRDEQEYLRHSIRNTVLSTALLVSLCGLVGWVVGLLFVGRPVRELVEQARRIGAGDLTRRLALRQKDELGELASEMNDMCDALLHARERLETETRARIDAIEQLKHTDRLRTVGTLASGVAHELGTPITVVEGHAQLILEDAAAGEQAHENAKIITRQTKRMAGIIRQLLNFARREQSGSEVSKPTEVARRTLQMLEPFARKRDVVTHLVGDDDLTAAIPGDELQQVLTNVVMNGIQAMPEGGSLTVLLSKLRAAPPFSSDPPRDVICLSIEDEGSGMSPETLRRVFEPFFTTKEVGEGTGLGLAVAYSIIQERSGWIDVASGEGEGSRFAIFVPAGAPS